MTGLDTTADRVQASAISRAGARAICQRPWVSETVAQSVIRRLEESRWLVDRLREPVEVTPGVWAVASIREPGTGARIGDVTYEVARP